ncbi:MAG TPA: hypothetical protein VF824_02725 [Thermoanaerobaculia bacterium]|jgi:protocatechuate 3,4-dioxygenase beta subunit
MLLLTLALLASPHIATIAAPSEPGTRLIVHGQLFDPSGTRPAAGVTVRAHHTDAHGIYQRPGAKEPRLRGTAVTDAQGRFELHTIRPGVYPGGGTAAHIHLEVSGGGYAKQWPAPLQFDDDRYLTAQDRAESRARGRFANVMKTTRDANGVLHAHVLVRLERR